MYEDIGYYVDQLRSDKKEDAFFALLHMDDTYVPRLIEAYRRESDVPTQAMLVEIIWQHRQSEIQDFLSEALQHKSQEVWKNALDGIVSIGGDKSLELLKKERQRIVDHPASLQNRLQWIDEAIGQIKGNIG